MIEIKPPKKPTPIAVTRVNELEENSKLMEQIEKGKVEKPKNFKLPKLEFLQKAPRSTQKINELEIDKKIEDLLAKLREFKVEGDVVCTYSGPLVTTFEFKPAPNVKVSKILGLQDDLAMALSAETIRIQAPIRGRDVVGIEIPNETIETIYLREILESNIFKESSSPLTVALGKDIVGNPFVTDLKKLPHLLIAGTTGSGKSVGINAMILSLLYRNDPDQLKLMLIDPKMLEFSMYNDIPHLITPVITEPSKAIAALANMVGEMERRYKLMAESRTKNIENYNEKCKKEEVEPFPFIVIVIDELADLMMNGGKEVELSIARLAQKSRACGIHLVVATQRPSVDVVTGLIKANLPSRLSYRVGSRIDSKVILDALGADSLLGRGDGLFTPPGTTGLVRIHAPWNTEDEIDKVVEFLKAQRVPDYDESYLVAGGSASGASGNAEITLDALYEEAKNIILSDNKTSISYLQRKLQIGYNRSANIIEQLELKGVLSVPNAKGNREIL
ncbi:MAG: DNA translocase FtsK [Sulfurovum sp.]|nr:DNA translocase FtsK [Sulfurovum sp.]